MSTPLLVLGAAVLGILAGGLASRGGRGPQGERRTLASRAVRPVARLVSAVVEPLFYWLGLLDPDGHPDNSKVLYSLVVFGALAATLDIGHDLKDATWPFVGLVCAVMLGAAGPRVLLKALRVWRPQAFADTPAPASTAAAAPGAGPGAGPGSGA